MALNEMIDNWDIWEESMLQIDCEELNREPQPLSPHGKCIYLLFVI